eukprot:3140706-Amphidinium_carterae.1
MCKKTAALLSDGLLRDWTGEVTGCMQVAASGSSQSSSEVLSQYPSGALSHKTNANTALIDAADNHRSFNVSLKSSQLNKSVMTG